MPAGLPFQPGFLFRARVRLFLPAADGAFCFVRGSGSVAGEGKEYFGEIVHTVFLSCNARRRDMPLLHALLRRALPFSIKHPFPFVNIAREFLCRILGYGKKLPLDKYHGGGVE